MKVLVTGGAGYIGAQLVYELSKQPGIDKIIVYDNLSRGNYNLFISSSNKIRSNNVEFVFGDLLDSRKLKKSLDGVDVVYHFAAKVAQAYENIDSHFYEQVNNWGTAELCYAIDESPSVKKLIYLSSTSVYGFSKKEPLTEESRLNPRTFYAISKMRGEEHVKRLMGKIDAVIVRSGNVYGYSPSIRFDAVINRFLFDANFNNRIQIHGSGKQSRSFICVQKLMDTMVWLLSHTIPSDTYNLVDKTYKILDLVDIFKEIYPPLEFIFINQHLDLRDLIVDRNTKLSQYYELPETDMKEEIIDIKEKSFAF